MREREKERERERERAEETGGLRNESKYISENDLPKSLENESQ